MEFKSSQAVFSVTWDMGEGLDGERTIRKPDAIENLTEFLLSI